MSFSYVSGSDLESLIKISYTSKNKTFLPHT